MNRKKTIRFSSITALVVIVVLTSGIMYLTSGAGEEYLRRKLERVVTDITGSELNIGHLDTDIFTRIQLNDVTLIGDDSLSLFAQDVNIRYNIWSLVMFNLEIESIDINKLRFLAKRDTGGNIQFVSSDYFTTKNESAGTSFFNVHLREFILRDAEIEFEDKTYAVEVILSDFSSTITFGIDELISFRMEAGNGTIGYNNHTYSVDKIEVNGEFKDQIVIENFTFELPGVRGTGHAAVDFNASAQNISGDIRIQADFDQAYAHYESIIPAELGSISGIVQSDISISGIFDNPVINGDVRFRQMQLSGINLYNGILRGRFDSGIISLDTVRTDIFNGLLSSSGRFSFESRQFLDCRAAFSGINLPGLLERIYSENIGFLGTADGEIDLSGSVFELNELEVSGSFYIRDAAYRSKDLPDFNNTFEMRNGIAKILSSQGNSTLTGEVLLDQRDQVNGKFSVFIEDIIPFAALFNIENISGNLNALGTIEGTTDNPIISAEIDARNLQYEKIPVDRLNGKFLYQDQKIFIERSTFSGSVLIDEFTELPFQSSGFEGRVSYRGNLSGKLLNPAGELYVQFKDPVYRTFEADSCDISLHLRDSVINVTPLVVLKDSMRLTVHADYSLKSSMGNLAAAIEHHYRSPHQISREDIRRIAEIPGTVECMFSLADSDNMTLNAAGSGLSLHEIQAVFFDTTYVHGSGAFDLIAAGNLTNPSGSLQFTLISPRYNDLALDSLKSILRITPQNLYYDPIIAYDGSDSVTIYGSIDLIMSDSGNIIVNPESNISGVAVTNGISLQVFNPLISQDFKMFGRGVFDLHYGGRLERPHFSGKISIENSTLRMPDEDEYYRDINAEITLADSVVFIEIFSAIIEDIPFGIRGELTHNQWNTFYGTAHLNISGVEVLLCRGQFSKDSLDISLLMDNFDVSILNPIFPYLSDYSGSVDSEIFIRGSPENPVLYGTAHLNISGVEVLLCRGQFNEDSLDISLLMDDFDISTLHPLFPYLPDYTGYANSEIIIRGSPDNPTFFGNINIDSISAAIPEINSTVSNCSLSIFFERNRINVTSFSGNFNNGSFDGTGEILIDNREITDISIGLNAQNIRVQKPRTYELSIDRARFVFDKNDDYYDLDGDIYLNDSRVLYNFQPTALIPFFGHVERPVQSPPPFYQKTRLNVRLRESDQLWVDNNLARLRMHSELNIIGYLAQPNLTGRLIFEEGYILYLDRKFRVLEGTMDFVDPLQINPLINLRAESQIKSYQAIEGTTYTVTMSLTGFLEQAQFQVSSDPPLDRSDILSLLTLGATREQFTARDPEGRQASTRNILIERAGELSSPMISGFASNRIGSLFGLEEMTIEGNLFTFGQNWGPELVASRKISENFGITYSTKVGHSNDQTIRLEYLLTKYLSLQGQTNQTGNSSLDLKIRLKRK
ncbi:translocation/assembly module TamB domain-containing protein [candidate division KSB1 bacterium]